MDPIQIQQVVINLIRNAVEAVQDAPRREILVSSRVVGDTAEIRVDDSGPGIKPEMTDSFLTPSPAPGRTAWASGSRSAAPSWKRMRASSRVSNREAGGASFCVALPLADRGRTAEDGEQAEAA